MHDYPGEIQFLLVKKKNQFVSDPAYFVRVQSSCLSKGGWSVLLNENEQKDRRDEVGHCCSV